MKENISPEERLLRLIRGKKQDAPRDGKSGQSSGGAGFSLHPSIRNIGIRNILFAFLALSCIYLIISFVYPLTEFNKIKLPEIALANIESAKTAQAEKGPEIKPYESIMQDIGDRQIFGGVSGSEKAAPVTVASPDLVKDINLVAIISGDNPQAAIEDKKSQKTYYVGKGQFAGEFQVEDIQDGKVILNYKGQRVELYL